MADCARYFCVDQRIEAKRRTVWCKATILQKKMKNEHEIYFVHFEGMKWYMNEWLSAHQIRCERDEWRPTDAMMQDESSDDDDDDAADDAADEEEEEYVASEVLAVHASSDDEWLPGQDNDVQAVHAGVKKRWRCKYCEASFSAKGSALEHMSTLHHCWRSARWECAICGKLHYNKTACGVHAARCMRGSEMTV